MNLKNIRIKSFLCSMILLFLVNSSSYVFSKPYKNILLNSQPKKWFELKINEFQNNFKFNSDGTISYNQKKINKIHFSETTEKISISPVSEDKKYAILVTFEDLQSKCFLLDLINYSGQMIKMDGPPIVWASWSPKSSFILLGSYYEADMNIYSINLSNRISQKINFNIDIKKTLDGYPLEEITYDLYNLIWFSNNVFEITINVNCNPYTDNNCDDQKRNKILRSFQVEYDVRNNRVIEVIRK